jgi:two-component system response regulator NreC
VKAISVVIADDHAVVRTGLRMMIDAEPDIGVVAEAGDGAGLLRIVRDHRPDVALIDFTMPDTDTLAVIRQIAEELSHTRVVVLTMHEDPFYLDSALAAGAAGYVVKSAADREVLAAIRAARAGRTFVDAGKAGQRAAAAGPRAGGLKRSPLSPRERQVLGLIGQGYTNKEVAARIGVGEKTVETYRARVAHKLGLQSRADFVRIGHELGLVVDRRRD